MNDFAREDNISRSTPDLTDEEVSKRDGFMFSSITVHRIRILSRTFKNLTPELTRRPTIIFNPIAGSKIDESQAQGGRVQ
jgi:hypothetical protein